MRIFDESKRGLVKFTGDRVLLLACSQCNIACKHCFVGYSGNRSPEELKNLAKHFTNKGKIVRIDGAEILTEPRYLDTHEIIGQDWIQTNGVIIKQNPEILKLLTTKGIKTIFLSYHFGIQDSINNISYSDLKGIIKIISSYGLKFGLLTTITSTNISRLEKICEEARELGASDILFTKILLIGKAAGHHELLPSEEQIDAFFYNLNRIRTQYNKEVFSIRRNGAFGHDPYAKHDHMKCSCGVRKVALAPDNRIYGCANIASTGLEIGKFIDGEIYLFEDFYNDRSWCMADKCGRFGKDKLFYKKSDFI